MSTTRSNQKSLIKKSMKLSMDESNLFSYQEIKDKLLPFDLIAFRGGDLISDLITILEEYQVGVGVFSHVGMVVTADILPNFYYDGKEFTLKPNHPYILESTFSYNIKGIMDNSPDVIIRKGHLGVQLRDLEEVIPRYIIDEKTKVAWCKLLNNPFDIIEGESIETSNRRRDIVKEKFINFFESYHGRLYEMNPESLFAAMFPSLRFIRSIRDNIFKSLFEVLCSWGITKKKTDPSGWQFCSELVANVYQTINVISEDFDPRDILPIDFFGNDQDNLPGLVSSPIFIKDWDLPGNSAVHYAIENVTHNCTIISEISSDIADNSIIVNEISSEVTHNCTIINEVSPDIADNSIIEKVTHNCTIINETSSNLFDNSIIEKVTHNCAIINETSTELTYCYKTNIDI